MLPENVWQEIAKRTGLEVDELQKKISSEQEEEIEFKPFNNISDEDIEQLRTNAKKEGTRDHLIFATEKLVKAFRDKHGLELDEKIKYTSDNMIDFEATAENISNSYRSKIESDLKIEPEKKVKEWQEKYDTLKNTYDTQISSKEEEINNYKSKIFNKNVLYYLDTTMPDNLPDSLTKEDAKLITKNAFKFLPSDNELEFELNNANGESFRDKLGNIRDPKEVLSEYYISKGWTATNGRGGNDTEPNNNSSFSSLKTKNDVIAWCEKENIPLSEYHVYLAKAKKENTEFKI